MDTQQLIIDTMRRIEDKVDALTVDVALLKRESENRRIYKYIQYGVVLGLSIVGGWFGYHISVPAVR